MSFPIPVNQVKAACQTLEQELANYGREAKSAPPLPFVNKVLLKERQWLLLPHNSLLITTQQRLHDPQSQKYLPSGTL